jgi:hypothetical protein
MTEGPNTAGTGLSDFGDREPRLYLSDQAPLEVDDSSGSTGEDQPVSAMTERSVDRRNERPMVLLDSSLSRRIAMGLGRNAKRVLRG